MKIQNYAVILKSELGGGYTAIVPSLPGCVTYGKTVEEAKEMAKDAIEAYLTSVKKHEEKVPDGSDVFLTSVFANA